MKQLFVSLILLVSCAFTAPATVEIPSFASDREMDAWLRKQSPAYRKMAETVEGRGGYEILRTPKVREKDGSLLDVPTGFAFRQAGERKIALNPNLAWPESLAVLAFEMTNHFQEDLHAEINADAKAGKIRCAEEYAILRELVEYDGLRMLIVVLTECERSVGQLPPETLRHLVPRPTRLSEYRLPPAYGLIKSQAASGHRDVYIRQYQILTKAEAVGN